MILSQALTPVLSKGPNNTAIHFLGKDTSYRELLHWTARFSYLFQKEIGAQKRVAYIGSNSAAFIPAFFALTNNRSLTIPIDPNLPDNDVGQWVYETQPTHALVTSDYVGRIRDLFRRQGFSIPIIELEKKRGGEYDTSFVAPVDNQPLDKDEVLLLRTARTAGRYKYCAFNHLHLQAPIMGVKRLYHFSGNERVFTSINWANPYAFVHGMLVPILSGAAVVVDLGFRNEELLDFFEKAHPTRLVEFPDFLQKLAIVCQREKRKLVGVKTATVSVGKLSREAAAALAGMQVKVINCYGITENLWTICMSDGEAHEGPAYGLIGLKYKVIDANGDEVTRPPREGQLCVTGPTVMLGYQGHLDGRDEDEIKKLNIEAIRGTWLYTGDICRLEEKEKDVLVTFLRRKDGLNPAPKDLEAFVPDLIEGAVRAQPGVKDAAVYRDGAGKNAPIRCAVVRDPAVETSEFQVLEGAKGSLTPANTPASILFVEEIPRAADGKIDLEGLAKLFEKPKAAG